MPIVIDQFRDKYFPFSNFSPHMVTVNNTIYRTSEHAFQAAKATTEEDRAYVACAPTPGEAKKRGREITCRPDWDEIKVEIMTSIVCDKVLQNIDVHDLLVSTGDALLIEGNNWGDNYWGMIKDEDGLWRGRNMLGYILMRVRDSL